MKKVAALCLMLGVGTLGLVGCAEKSSSTTEKKITTPGGTTTIKETTEIKKTGENPP